MNFSHQIALEWAIRCFGQVQIDHKPTRALRIAEEAVELAQAVGVTREEMHLFHKELRRVLSKPVEHFAERNKEKLDLGLGSK